MVSCKANKAEETRRTLLLVEAMLFGLVRKDQPMELYWDPEMVGTAPAASARREISTSFRQGPRGIHHGLSGPGRDPIMRATPRRFAVSTGCPAGRRTSWRVPNDSASGNTLRWRIMDSGNAAVICSSQTGCISI